MIQDVQVTLPQYLKTELQTLKVICLHNTNIKITIIKAYIYITLTHCFNMV